MLTSAITSHYGHLRLAVGNSHTEQVGHLPHDISTSHGAAKSFQRTGISTLDKSVSHTSATGKAATATVCTRQEFVDLSNAGVFIDSKFLGGGKQHQCSYQADGSKDNYCNQDKIHKLFVLIFV